MNGFAARLIPVTTWPRCLLATVALAAGAPMAAQAAEVTFDWVPYSENPTMAQTTTAKGFLTLDLPSWNLTDPNIPPNYAPYYTDGTGAAAAVATVTAFSFTSASGITVDKSNLSTITISTAVANAGTLLPPSALPPVAIWATSGLDTPAAGEQAPTQGYYLTSGFAVSGRTAQGTAFMMSNNIGDAGATFQNGIPNGDATFQLDAPNGAIEDGGYWELAPVPLPATLPLLLSALGLAGWFMRRRSPRSVA